MREIRRVADAVYYSLPIQLFVRHLRYYKVLLLFWIFLLALLSGMVGASLGGAYLLLEPEYLGKENFWSYFIVGSALGTFLFAYMITFFINESYRFDFIARHKSPFYALSLNNLLIPGGFLILYFWVLIRFHLSQGMAFGWAMGEKLGGIFLGMAVVFLLSATYFFAKQSFLQRLGQLLEQRFTSIAAWRNRMIILSKARHNIRNRQRADSYLTFPFHIVTVEEPAPDQFRKMVQILSQNHGKLLVIQLLIFLLISLLGLLEDKPTFQIPAGASLLLLLALLLMVFGAITFWFRRLGAILVVGSLLLLGVSNQMSILDALNPAYGMDYSVPPARYEKDNLLSLASVDQYKADRAATLAYLENWKRGYAAEYGTAEKPRAVFVTASGGGLRSALWTFRVMQQLDSLTQGRLADETRLLTGASGGMVGLTYYRELLFRREMGQQITLAQPEYTQNISKDLLNRIFFQRFSNMILPQGTVTVGNQTYERDRGYSFDDQLARNLPELAQRKLGDYSLAEAQGIIPPSILTPTVINQGRKLYISSCPVSFLTRPNQITDHYQSKSYGIEFRRLFEDHEPDSLLITTALRMNATFPYVLPIVDLPSQPVMQVMDAGAIDNYGTQTAVKYLFEFKDWFAANTSGVIFIEIRDNYRDDPIRDGSGKDMLSDMMRPLGGGLYSMSEARDMANDYLLEFVPEWYEGYVEVIPLEYPRETFDQPASLSWHLTQREKKNIQQCLHTPENEAKFAMISALYGVDWIAIRDAK